MAITTGSYRRGTVLAGGEYGDRGSAYGDTGAVGGLTYTNPGTYGSDYLYPAAADLAYIAGRMPNAVCKLMVRMERLTSSPGGPLRSEEVTRITDVLDGARTAGVGIVINPWNFGAIWTDDGTGTAVRHPIGDPVFTQAVFNDFWTRVMTQWGDHPALIGVELMTEPIDIPGGAASWEAATQSALDTIRAASSSMIVWVPNYGWGIHEINLHTGGPWISDPTGNFGYTGHQYNYNRGGSQTDYANALDSAVAQGYTAGTEADALHAREVQSARAWKNWLGSHVGFMSEYGYPQSEHTATTEAAKWRAFADRMLKEYDAQKWWGTVWTSGRVVNADTLYSVYYPTGGWNTNVNAGTSLAATIEAHPSVIVSTANTGSLKIGGHTISAIRVGSTTISRVYSGNTLIFDNTAQAPVITGLTPTSKTQAEQDSAVQALWTTWKGNLREKPENGWWAVLANAQVDPVTGVAENPYVAEGQGYGMMLCAQMAPYDPNARTYFDGITKYVLDHPSAIDSRLHAAEQDANMVTHNGGDSATDGDLDIAMGLLMAHQRWGSGGTYNYLELAKTKITAVKESLVSPVTGLMELGDWSADYTATGGRDWTVVSRPSDWMIGHFEAFKRATGDTAWDTIRANHITAVQRIQSVYSPSTGLVPDFTIDGPSVVHPAAPNTLETANDGDYYYNACRVPWRLGVAADADSRAASAKIAAWAKTKSGGNPAVMPTGYALDGTTVGGTYQDLSFIAPFAVGAANGSDQAWLNSLWDYMAANTTTSEYYAASIQLACMIYLSRTYYLDPLTSAAPATAAVRSTSTAAVPYNTTAKTIAKPTGTVAGDVLVFIAHCDYGAAADFKAPTGFSTLVTKELAANGDKQLVAYRVATSTEPDSYTIGVPLDADLRADMLAIQGADPNKAPVIATANTAASATTHAAPSVSPTTNRNLLISSVSLSAGTGGQTFSWTPPSGMTEVSDAVTNGYVSLTTATQTWDSTSATGTRSFALTTTAAGAAGMGMSLLVSSGSTTSDGGGGTTDSGGGGGVTYDGAASSGGTTGTYEARNGIAFSDGTTSSVYNLDATATTVDVASPLVIHLHGDGYEEYTQMAAGTAGVWQNYAKVAKAHGGIFVIPRTPDTASGTWWELTTPTTWLVALIKDLQKRFNIDLKRIFLSGYSGGAEMITYNLMADHHTLFQGGGAMILAGGGAEGLTGFTGTPTTALKSQFPMHWAVGENDDGSSSTDSYHAIKAATGGESWYDAAGFNTTLTGITGADHYQSEQYGPHFLNRVINQTITAYGLPSVSVSVPAPAGTKSYLPVASLGSGGSWTDAISGSRTFSDGVVSSSYRIWASHVTNRTGPIPLVIHFHGDGAYEYENPTSFTGPPYMQIAKDLGGIGVIPLTPHSDQTWWSQASSGNWAAALIRNLGTQYNLDLRRIFLSGFSGGSVMITTTLMARHHQDYLGGAAKMLGGGGNGTLVGTYTKQILRDFPMRWHVGELDDGRNTLDNYNARLYAENSEATYQGRGFNTDIIYIPGEDHNQSQNDGPAALRAAVNISQAIYGLPRI